jgi:hypothetical protein
MTQNKKEPAQQLTVAEDITEPTPTISGYMFMHRRATDTIYIGPFHTTNDAWSWYQRSGTKMGVQPNLVGMRLPTDNYNSLWGLLPEEM